MELIRKQLLPMTLILLIAFFSVLVAEGAHHHDEGLQDHSHCTFCSWLLTSSNATFTPVLPLLFHTWVFIAFFTFSPFYSPLFFISPSGRSPPSSFPA